MLIIIFKRYLGCLAHFFDGIDTEDGQSVAGYDFVAKVTITEELHVTRELTLRYRIRQFLQLKNLEIDALALVRHDKVRI